MNSEVQRLHPYCSGLLQSGDLRFSGIDETGSWLHLPRLKRSKTSCDTHLATLILDADFVSCEIRCAKWRPPQTRTGFEESTSTACITRPSCQLEKLLWIPWLWALCGHCGPVWWEDISAFIKLKTSMHAKTPNPGKYLPSRAEDQSIQHSEPLRFWHH